MNLSTPIEKLPRVGPQSQKRLKRLNIKTIKDLLYHFPHRYEDFSNLVKIADLPDENNETYSIQGRVSEIKTFRAFRKRMNIVQAIIEDETGKIKVVWFNQPYLITSLKKGTLVSLAGKIKGQKSSKYFSSPNYERITSNETDLTHTGRLVPVYPETEGLSSKWLRFLVKPVLNQIGNLNESLPKEIIEKYKFLPLRKALWQIHFPTSLTEANQAKKRFSFEELFHLSIFVLRERLKLSQEKAQIVPININLMKKFTQGLPFKLTDAQRRSVWQILKDMEKPQPMNRLLEGDVGSGKTIVAIMALLNVAKNNYQTAFLAPTEILANQHQQTILNSLKTFKVKIGLMTSKTAFINKKKVTRKELAQAVAKGEVDLLIGTHAILQDYYPTTKKKTPIKFKNLALVIIDEQHRFGTEQRASLCKQKTYLPHLLSMTATPIPRTLSLTIYGDLDLSILDQLPKGRKKVITKIIQEKDKSKTYRFVEEKIKEGRQAFVICPRIEPSQANENKINSVWLEVKTVKEEYERLSQEVFPNLKIAMLHGRMKSEEKEKIMKKFKSGKTDILVSTSVIEVGVDIPNASVMIIEGAERFGLAQLHQFRGRIGRSEHQSFCFLFTDNPGLIYNRRLRAIVNCQDGFELAEKDLQIRGPGDFTGQRQWGLPDLAMASLADTLLVSRARNEAKEILKKDPNLKNYPQLKNKVKEIQERIHLE